MGGYVERAPLRHVGSSLKPALSRWLWALLCGALLCVAPPSIAAAQVRYQYDTLGRLIQAVAPDGASVQYSYDAAGNITAIRRVAASTLSLIDFSPKTGAVGSSVTLVGSGFNPLVTGNSVSFNGTPATVAAASAQTLTVTVPAGATTGRIAVSNGGGTVLSATDYTVAATAGAAAPSIVSFSPQVGTVGTMVTVMGGGFQPALLDNKVRFGAVSSVVVQDADSPADAVLKTTVPAPLASGKVTISTPFGTAVSAEDFYAVPSSVSPAAVAFKGRLAPDGPAFAGATTVANQFGVLLFDGVQGAAQALEITATTMAGGTITVYRSDGTIHASGNISTGAILRLPAFPTTGVYTAIVSPGANIGSIAVRIGKTDLTISAVTVGTVVANNSGSWTIPVTYTVTNAGSITAPGGWYDLAYLSVDTLLDNADQSNGSLTYRSSALAPGSSYTVTGNFTTSTSTAAGSYTLFVKTDGHSVAYTGGTATDNGNVAEGDETNNLAPVASITLSRPDLSISAVTAGTVVANNSGSWTIPVTYTLTNAGTVAAQSGWYDVAYLSVDGVLDNADQSNSYLVYRNTTLAPGASYTVTANFITSTSTAAGSYTLFVKADGHNASHTGGTATDNGNVSEGDETNNLASVTSFTLNKPDLSIGAVTVGTVVANNNGSWTIPVTYTVTNAGSITAQSGWYDVAYLSVDGVLDNADQSSGYLASRNATLAPGASYTVTANFTTSTSTAAGSYTLFVKTDGHNASYTGGAATDNGNVSEGDEVNNLATVASFTLTRPDLSISALTVGTVVANNNGSWTIPVTYTVTNPGNIAVQGGWHDVAYLSSDAVLDNADQSNSQLNYRSSALVPGGSYTVTANFTTSTTTAVGAYTLFVKTDGHNASYTGGANTDNGNVVEGDETNNSASVTGFTLSKPDLSIGAVAVGTVVANSNGSWTIPVTYTVTNAGSIAAQGGWHEVAYLSVDAVLDNADQSNSQLTYRSSALAPGASFTVTANFTTSTTTAVGAYTLFVKTDGHNASYTGGTATDNGNVSESDETNNLASVTGLTLSKPDLSIGAVTVGALVANNAGSWTVPVTYTVTNVGTMAAQGTWYDMAYLSSDTVLDNADQSNGYLASRGTALAAGASYTVTANFTTSTTTAVGAYTLFVKTDGRNASYTGGTATDSGYVSEGDETNNVASVSGLTLSKPDLSISAVTVGTLVANNSGSWTIPVTYTVTNVGTMAAQSSWYDMAYLSSDAVLDNADQSNGYLSSRGTALAPGASYTVTANFTTSTGTAVGSYTLFVKTDGHNTSYTGGAATDNGYVSEGDETNNLASVSGLALSKPDLSISAVTVGTLVTNNSGSWTIPVTYTVTNVGSMAAQSGWYDIAYLSADAVLDNADQSNGYLSSRSTALAPGASFTVTASFTTSTTTVAGAYTLFVKTDGRNASYTGGAATDNGNVSEGDETNNLASVAGLTLSKPDLSISALTVGTVVANNTGSWTIPVTYTVTNAGGMTVQGGWYDMAYLSVDGVLDNTDQSNGYLANRNTTLVPGASYTVTANFTTSTSTAAGSYTLFVKADGHNTSYTGGTATDNGNVSEAGEANNATGATVVLTR